MDHLGNKQQIHRMLAAFAQPDAAAVVAAVRHHYAPNCIFHVAHPFNDIAGADAYIDQFLNPLRAAFQGLYRRDYILMAGEFDGSEWVSSTGYYCGHFANPLLGIAPTGTLAYLRVGEFHRLESVGGRPDGDKYIVESYVYLDLPELMIAADQWPIKDSPGCDRGYTGPHRGPATQDGVQLHRNDPKRSTNSAAMVTDMLRSLATKDEAWRPYWHENMVWYGPHAFGSFIGIDNFAGFQVPFEQAFSLWSGGASDNGVTWHFTRHADGDYICTGGWPSLMCVRRGPFLDQPATTDTLFMRVCDWWRREGDLLVENWVFVDIPDVLLQMGVDLFPGAHDVAPGPRPLPERNTA